MTSRSQRARDSRLVIALLGVSSALARTEIGDIARRLGARVAAIHGAHAPSLVGVLDDLAAEGDKDIEIVALVGEEWQVGFSWLRRVAGHWVRTRGSVQILVADDRFDHAAELERWVEKGRPYRPVTGQEAPLTNPAWESPPEHRHHVLVCRGPRCNAQGAEATAQALSKALAREGRLDEDVLVAQTGCLYPCNRAPVVVVHPAGTWHGPVDPADVPALVADHLAADQPAPGRP